MPASSGFDRLARSYHLLERFSFGGALQRCRVAELPRMLAARQALVLGDGDGRFIAALLAANPHVRITAVDSSAAMLAQLAARAERLGAANRLTTYQADALQFLARETAPVGGYDLLTTHFFLDCLLPAELHTLATSVRPQLTPDALWVVSDFATPTLWARVLVAGLYLAFRVTAGLHVRRLPPIRSTLLEAGFTPSAERTCLHGLLTSSVWVLQTALASAGADRT